MSFIEVTYRNVGEWFLSGARNDSKTDASPIPPQHGWQLMKSGTLEHTAAKLESVFQEAQVVSCQLNWSATFRQLGLSKSVTRLPLLLIQVWGGMELLYLVSFRNFLTLLSCLSPELKELPYMMKCFTSFRTSCVLKQLSSEVDFKTEEIVKQPPLPVLPFPLCFSFPILLKLISSSYRARRAMTQTPFILCEMTGRL